MSKRGTPVKSGYLSAVGLSSVKIVADRHRHAALLINRSLVTGCFPAEFKQAIVHLLLKKSGLDASEMKSYRPVSNLSSVSKLLEKVVQERLQAFLDSNNLMPCT